MLSMRLKAKFPLASTGAQEGLKFTMYLSTTHKILPGQSDATLLGQRAKGQRDIQTNVRQFPTFCYTSEGPKILNES